MAHITPLSNLPQADSAPSTTNVRRSSRLQAKLTAVEPQTHFRMNTTQTSPVSKNENEKNSGNYISSMTHEEAAETLLMFKLYPKEKKGQDIYELLPYSVLSTKPTAIPNALTNQSHDTSTEKENVAAPLVKATTGATQVATTTTTPPLNGQPSKSKKKTSKRAHHNTLKRKAAAVDASETTGSVPHAQKTEPRAIKRLRTKFVADPSDRVTRSSKSNVEVEGADANRTLAQKDGTDEQATATTSTDNNIVNSSAESVASSIDPAVEAKALNDNSAQRPRPTLVIPARTASAVADTVATTNNSTPAVESAVTLKGAEVGPKALDSAEKEHSATPKIRVLGGKRISATV